MMSLKIGERVYVHGHVDEIRKDTVIIRNEGGYFGTVPSEVVKGDFVICKDCKHAGEVPNADGLYWCDIHDTFMRYCSDAERREE